MAGSITVLVTFGWQVTKGVRRFKASIEAFKKTWDSYGARLDEVHDLCRDLNVKVARLVALKRAERDLEGSCTFEATDAGSVVYVSHGWTRLTGCAIDAARGSGWLSCVHPDSREEVRDAWRTALATSETFDVEFFLTHGTKVRGRAKPLYDGGTVVGWAALWERVDQDFLDDSHPNLIRMRQPH